MRVERAFEREVVKGISRKDEGRLVDIPVVEISQCRVGAPGIADVQSNSRITNPEAESLPEAHKRLRLIAILFSVGDDEKVTDSLVRQALEQPDDQTLPAEAHSRLGSEIPGRLYCDRSGSLPPTPHQSDANDLHALLISRAGTARRRKEALNREERY
jgi:hypothetical protein